MQLTKNSAVVVFLFCAKCQISVKDTLKSPLHHIKAIFLKEFRNVWHWITPNGNPDVFESTKHRDCTWHVHQTASCSRLTCDVISPQRRRSLTLWGPRVAEVFLGWTEGKELDKTGLPISAHTGSHGIIMTSCRKSMIPLFLPVNSLQQWPVYEKPTVGLYSGHKIQTANACSSNYHGRTLLFFFFLWKIFGGNKMAINAV